MKLHDSKTIPIKLADSDQGLRPPAKEIMAEIRAADLDGGPPSANCKFSEQADILLPFLADLPARTAGAFTEIVIDLYAPIFAVRPDYLYEVDLYLRDELIESKTFRNFTQRHAFFVSTQLLFEQINTFTIKSRRLAGDGEPPRYAVSLFYVQERRLAEQLQKNSIWVFSTARSGSTWLSQDILCSAGKARPMDEPGIGRMFAPIDWMAERLYDISKNAKYFQSGFAYETGTKIRDNKSATPPFERSFIFAKQENQICGPQNWKMYLSALRQMAFRHVVSEWGIQDYKRVVFKMPNEAHAADVIMQAFKQSFMIFLIRDGRDVMKSRFSPFASKKLAATKDLEMRKHAIAFYAHFWNFQIDIIQAAYEAHWPERRLIVHYEAIRQHPADLIAMILDRVGMLVSAAELAELIEKTTLENIPADQKGPDKPRQTGLVGGFAGVFSTQEIGLMESIMGPNLERFGYAVGTNERDQRLQTAEA